MPKFLHVGCGHKRKDRTTPGFAGPEWDEVRLDIDPEVKPDVIASMTDMTPVADGAVDALYSSHNIEHLYEPDVLPALREFRRVVADDGFVVITCPDVQSVAAVVAEGKLMEPLYVSPAGPIAPIDTLFGLRSALAKGNHYMAHRTAFTADSLSQYLRRAGFAKVIVRRRPNHYELWAAATRSAAPDERLRELAASHFPPA